MTVTSVQTKWGAWDAQMLRRLKDGYEAARRDSKRVFILEGSEVLTDFAKYLIEYLEGEGLVAAPRLGRPKK